MLTAEVLNKFKCKQSLITKLNCFIKVLECTHYNPDNYLALYEYMIRYLDSQSMLNRGDLDSKKLSKLLINDIETKYSVFNSDSAELENIRKIKEGINLSTENIVNEFEKCITGEYSEEKFTDNEDNYRYRAFPFTSKTDKGEIYQGLTDYLQDVLCLKRIDSNNARNTASKGHIAIYCERGCYTDDVKEIKSLIKDVLTISKYKSKVNLKQYIDELFSDVNNSPKILQPNVIVVRNGTIIIDMENPLKKDGSPNIEFKPHSPEYISFNPLNCEYLQDVDTKKLEDIIMKYAVNDDTHEVSEATFQNIIQAFALFLNPTNDFKKEPLFTNSNGNNGKSTLLSFLSGLYGSNNCSFKDADQIKGNQFVFADLYGKRINIIDEIEENASFPIAVIKRITGGSQIPYNQKFEPVFDFYPRIKNIYGVNNMPYISDKALLKRWYIIPFNHVFNTGAKVELKTKANFNAMFSLMLREYANMLDRFNHGKSIFTFNKDSEDFLKEYSKKTNPVYEWIGSFDRDYFLQKVVYPKGENNLTPKQRYAYTIDEIYNEFREWAKSNDKYKHHMIGKIELKNQILSYFQKELTGYEIQLHYPNPDVKKKYQGFLFKN